MLIQSLLTRTQQRLFPKQYSVCRLCFSLCSSCVCCWAEVLEEVGCVGGIEPRLVFHKFLVEKFDIVAAGIPGAIPTACIIEAYRKN